MEKTRAVGLISKAGRYGGTYAHALAVFENYNPQTAIKILLKGELRR